MLAGLLQACALTSKVEAESSLSEQLCRLLQQHQCIWTSCTVLQLLIAQCSSTSNCLTFSSDELHNAAALVTVSYLYLT